MPAVLKEIDEMDVAEKVRTMDYLWNSLQSASSGYEPPAWHGEELARRQRLYEAGQVPAYDWAEVRVRLEARRAAL